MISWLETKQGISDLRRYWGWTAADIPEIPYDELEAYFDTLPPDSATLTMVNKLRGGDLGHFLLARLSDEIRSLKYSMAGKRMPKEGMITDSFLLDSRAAQTEAFKERVIRKREAEARAREMRDSAS